MSEELSRLKSRQKKRGGEGKTPGKSKKRIRDRRALLKRAIIRGQQRQLYQGKRAAVRQLLLKEVTVGTKSKKKLFHHVRIRILQNVFDLAKCS